MYLLWCLSTTNDQRRYTDGSLEESKLHHLYLHQSCGMDPQISSCERLDPEAVSPEEAELRSRNECVDHVHLIVEIAPNRSVGQVLEFLNAKFGPRIMDKLPHLKKRYWSNHFWSPKHYVSTVGGIM